MRVLVLDAQLAHVRLQLDDLVLQLLVRLRVGFLQRFGLDSFERQLLRQRRRLSLHLRLELRLARLQASDLRISLL